MEHLVSENGKDCLTILWPSNVITSSWRIGLYQHFKGTYRLIFRIEVKMEAVLVCVSCYTVLDPGRTQCKASLKTSYLSKKVPWCYTTLISYIHTYIYVGESNENCETVIKIQNITPLSYNADKENAISVPVWRWLLYYVRARKKNSVL
jgi:hypothetical protein